MSHTKSFRITDTLRAWRFQRTQTRRARAMNRERLRNAARKQAAEEALREMECDACVERMYARGAAA